MEGLRHQRFPDGRRLTLTACFLAISPKVGSFSMSRSDVELDKSVEDSEAMYACSMLIMDSLSGQFEISAILHMQGNDRNMFIIINYYNI